MIGRRFALVFLGTVALVVGLSYLLASILPANPDWIPHLATHAAIGVPVSVLAGFGWMERAQQRLAKSAGPTIVLVGISIIGAAQVLEAAAAWLEYPQMDRLHASAGGLTAIGIPLSGSGLVVTAASLLFKQPPRWLLIVGGIVLSVVTVLFIRTLVGL